MVLLEGVDGVVGPAVQRRAGVVEVRDDRVSGLPERYLAVGVEQVRLEGVYDVLDPAEPVGVVLRVLRIPLPSVVRAHLLAVVVAVEGLVRRIGAVVGNSGVRPRPVRAV